MHIHMSADRPHCSCNYLFLSCYSPVPATCSTPHCTVSHASMNAAPRLFIFNVLRGACSTTLHDEPLSVNKINFQKGKKEKKKREKTYGAMMKLSELGSFRSHPISKNLFWRNRSHIRLLLDLNHVLVLSCAIVHTFGYYQIL